MNGVMLVTEKLLQVLIGVGWLKREASVNPLYLSCELLANCQF